MNQRDLRQLSLLDLVPAINPDWTRPDHLSEWAALIEISLRGDLRAMMSVPVQHYKSTTTLCGVVWLLLRNPKLRILVITHSHEKAKAMGKDLRWLWKLAGGETRKGFDTIDDWQTQEGGGCIVMSAEQSKLGYAIDTVLVDDPLDENEYMLQDTRDRVDRSIGLYTARAASHLNSVLIVASRWHPDDPIGRRLNREAVSWKYVVHAGIEGLGTAEEHAFAPEVMSLEKHRRNRAEWKELDPSERSWWAQIQNNPLPDALGFFVGHSPSTVIVPQHPIVWGVDLAFTSGTKADFAAFVGMTFVQDEPVVFEVIRHQRGLIAAVDTLRSIRARFPGARFFSYVSGPEKGIYNAVYETDSSLMVEQIPARFDKGYRAQKYAYAWRHKQVRVVMGQSWTGPFIGEHHAFDGSDNGIDDQVDAGTAAFDAIQSFRAAVGFGTSFTFGSPGAAG